MSLRYRSLLLVFFFIGVATIGPTCVDGQAEEETELLELNASLFRAQIVQRDAGLLREVALPQFRVIAPGGLIENKDQAMAGVSAWDVESIELSGEEVIREGNVAVVLGRLDINGTMAPVGRFGPLKYMGVFVRDDGAWRFLSRSLTPCLDMLIQMGRC